MASISRFRSLQRTRGEGWTFREGEAATVCYLTEFRVDDARAVAIDALGRIVVGGQEEGTIHGIELTRHIPN